LYELHGSGELQLHIAKSGWTGLLDLLPLPFGPREVLGASRGRDDVEPGLLQSEHHELRLVSTSDDPMVALALEAAGASYAPYSKSFAGAVLLTRSGHVYVGRYAESVAFNPSVSPLLGALSQMALSNAAFEKIERAVLVHAVDTPVSHVESSREVLRAVSSANFDVHAAIA
jgi:cytidine deaminase